MCDTIINHNEKKSHIPVIFDSHATNSKATPKPCLANEVKFPTGRLAHKPREQWQHNLPKHIHLEFDSYFLSVYVSMINTYYLGICRIG